MKIEESSGCSFQCNCHEASIQGTKEILFSLSLPLLPSSVHAHPFLLGYTESYLVSVIIFHASLGVLTGLHSCHVRELLGVDNFSSCVFIG